MMSQDDPATKTVVHILPRGKRDGIALPPEDRKLVTVTADNLQKLLGLKQSDAAKQLGISLTALKSVCKNLGLSKWPYRRTVYRRVRPERDRKKDQGSAASEAAASDSIATSKDSEQEGSSSEDGVADRWIEGFREHFRSSPCGTSSCWYIPITSMSQRLIERLEEKQGELMDEALAHVGRDSVNTLLEEYMPSRYEDEIRSSRYKQSSIDTKPGKLFSEFFESLALHFDDPSFLHPSRLKGPLRSPQGWKVLHALASSSSQCPWWLTVAKSWAVSSFEWDDIHIVSITPCCFGRVSVLLACSAQARGTTFDPRKRYTTPLPPFAAPSLVNSATPPAYLA
eukprot:184513-Hanusia_phi.AAC.3